MNFSLSAKTFSVLAFSLIASISLAQSSGASGDALPKKDNAKTVLLSRAQFDQLLAEPERLVLIDVRRPDEVTAIGGFPVYLSIQLDDLEKSLAWIPKDRKIVTMSNHAARAGRAADFLAAKGFNVVGRIGVQTYEEQGGKLTKIEPRAPKGVASQKSAQAASAQPK